MVAGLVLAAMVAAGEVNFTVAIGLTVVINLLIWLISPWLSDLTLRWFNSLEFLDDAAVKQRYSGHSPAHPPGGRRLSFRAHRLHPRPQPDRLHLWPVAVQSGSWSPRTSSSQRAATSPVAHSRSSIAIYPDDHGRHAGADPLSALRRVRPLAASSSSKEGNKLAVSARRWSATTSAWLAVACRGVRLRSACARNRHCRLRHRWRDAQAHRRQDRPADRRQGADAAARLAGRDPWPFVDDAKQALAALAANRPVELKPGGSRLDRYGHLLAQVFDRRNPAVAPGGARRRGARPRLFLP